MEKGVIIIHREEESPNKEDCNIGSGGFMENFKRMKKSPLLEESLKAVIEETDEDLEEFSIFDGTTNKKHQKSIHEKINVNKFSEKKNTPNNKEKVVDNTPFFMFQPDQSHLNPKKSRNYFLPKLPDTEESRTFTLVLDLDETLVHFCEVPDDFSADQPSEIPEIKTERGETDIKKEKKKKHMFLVRPYVQTFLTAVSRYYEIVIFTASIKSYADYILDILDPDNKIIKHRLYRQHCDVRGNGFIKDLSKLGRKLSKTLIVDNSADNFRLQADNGILIKSWYGEEGDEALKTLGPLLERVVKEGYDDVRVALKEFKKTFSESGTDV